MGTPGPVSSGAAILPSGGLSLSGWRQTFSSLSGNRNFKFLFAGNIGFFFGMNMMIILSSWLVIEEWDNAAKLGELMAWVALPMLVLAPIAGVVTDRVDKRKLVLIAQSMLVVTNSIVALLIITGEIEFWHLRVVYMVSSAAFAFNMPARGALVALLVPREKLMNAVALSTAAMNASRIVAPPMAGLLVTPLGIGGAYVLSTVFYATAVVAAFFLPSMPPKREREFTFFEDFVGGFSYIRRSSVLLGLILFATVPMIFAMPYMTLLPVFAERVWHVGPTGFGVLQAAGGVGGLAGAFLVANLGGYPKKTRLLLGGALAFGGFLVMFALTPWFYLALVFIALLGFGSMIVGTVNNTAIQLVIPHEVRGRVMSVMMMTFGLMPLGSVPAGIVAERVGAPPVVAVSAGLFVVSALLVFLLSPAFRSLDREIAEGQKRMDSAEQEQAGEVVSAKPPPGVAEQQSAG
jgi:predicted MFS family arabinose efflux permease